MELLVTRQEQEIMQPLTQVVAEVVVGIALQVMVVQVLFGSDTQFNLGKDKTKLVIMLK